jgi:hypothetical protein
MEQTDRTIIAGSINPAVLIGAPPVRTSAVAVPGFGRQEPEVQILSPRPVLPLRTAAGTRARIRTSSTAASDLAIGNGQLRSSDIVLDRWSRHAFFWKYSIAGVSHNSLPGLGHVWSGCWFYCQNVSFAVFRMAKHNYPYIIRANKLSHMNR